MNKNNSKYHLDDEISSHVVNINKSIKINKKILCLIIKIIYIIKLKLQLKLNHYTKKNKQKALVQFCMWF